MLACKVCQGSKINEACVVDLGTNYVPLNCTLEKYAKYCDLKNENEPTMTDYWAGANKACQDLGMALPDLGTGNNLIKLSNGSLSGNYWVSDSAGGGPYGGYKKVTNSGYGILRTGAYKVFCVK